MVPHRVRRDTFHQPLFGRTFGSLIPGPAPNRDAANLIKNDVIECGHIQRVRDRRKLWILLPKNSHFMAEGFTGLKVLGNGSDRARAAIQFRHKM